MGNYEEEDLFDEIMSLGELIRMVRRAMDDNPSQETQNALEEANAMLSARALEITEMVTKGLDSHRNAAPVLALAQNPRTDDYRKLPYDHKYCGEHCTLIKEP